MKNINLPSRILILGLIFLAACNNPKLHPDQEKSKPKVFVDVIIDNPTDEDIVVIIDDSLNINLEPRSRKNTRLTQDYHLVKFKEKIDTPYIYRLPLYKKLLLNPTKSEYLKEKVMYSTDTFKDMNLPTKENGINFIKLRNYNIFGKYELIEDALVITRWDYGPYDRIPILLNRNKEDGMVENKIKLHRVDDFITEIEEGKRSENGNLLN